MTELLGWIITFLIGAPLVLSLVAMFVLGFLKKDARVEMEVWEEEE